jgi:hypothetical protein
MRQLVQKHVRQPRNPQRLGARARSVVAAAAAIVTLAILAPASAYAAKHLYKFYNADGSLEISHTIPTDRVALGYQIIDYSGRLIREVAAQKSQAEVDRINRETLARDACKTALARVNSLYQSELDIDSASQQAIKALDGRIANAQLNLRQALDQKRDFEATAAQLERSGKSLDAGLVNNIGRADVQAGNLEREIEKRRVEQDDARRRFAEDLALFKQATCADEAAFGFMQTEIATASGS